MKAKLQLLHTRLAISFFILLWATPPILAQRLSLKPHDFKPLTELPWRDIQLHETTQILERIFREPNIHIRHSVLASYLEQVPLIHFGSAFDVAVSLEGLQNPDFLVSLMLKIWARREPEKAFERVKQLLDLVGIEQGWLGYDSWQNRDPISVQNLPAIQKSRYWLERDTLASFPYNADLASGDAQKRQKLLKTFAHEWFDRFDEWPKERQSPLGLPELCKIFETGSAPSTPDQGLAAEIYFEVTMRKRLSFAPSSAPQIIRDIHTNRWQADEERRLPERAATVSREFFLLWSQVDFDGMRQWAESQAQVDAWTAKCILLHRVDEKTRQKWLKEIPANEKGDALNELAGWEPEMAMSEALPTKDPEVIGRVFEGCAYGWRAMNGVHAGLGYLSQFDLSRLPKACLDEVLGSSSIYVMEQWGAVDAGECARFGIRCLKHSPWVEWPELKRFFSGQDTMPDEGGVVDRTFCALRVWAVTNPDAMKSWIGTEPDTELRKALTWLLEHPWGRKSTLQFKDNSYPSSATRSE